ncbi:SPOR domain-containing protein [Bacteroides sp. 224]|uniref:SPOR domain-containing protein n=1 Tax=Bacteroides sp. 224 TaxID=2302936 RepID=UPI0013D4F6C1|nr:SPOR domain-containing protein [Bacteroides sp. 224]NDV67164.1 SPOR domain-containing protein [Bacteroides sp. 224]
MKKLLIIGMTACVVLAFTSCKSSESAYKKAYNKAKEQELAEPQDPVHVTEIAPVVTAPVQNTTTTPPVSNVVVREEKVTVVSGDDTLKDYSVVCGSFSVKANAENLKDFLTTEGYAPTIAFNADAATYRVIVSSYTDKESAAYARDTFKRRYPNRKDFQGSWLLYRLR